MVKLVSLSTCLPGADDLGNGNWRGKLLFTGQDRTIQHVVECREIAKDEADAMTHARNLAYAIEATGETFVINEYEFSCIEFPYARGFRGCVIFKWRADKGIPVEPPLPVLCSTFHETAREARYQAYAQADAAIRSGKVIDLLDAGEPGVFRE